MEKRHCNLVVTGQVGPSVTSALVMLTSGVRATAKDGTSFSQFESAHHKFTVPDTEGSFLRLLVTGARAEAALFAVDASTIAELNASIEMGGKLRNALMLVFTNFVKTCVICLDQMEDTFPPYSEEMYNKISEKLCPVFAKYGFEPSVVPISSKTGDNIILASDNLSWYKGPTLLEALDKIKLGRYRSSPPEEYSLPHIRQGTIVPVTGAPDANKESVMSELIDKCSKGIYALDVNTDGAETEEDVESNLNLEMMKALYDLEWWNEISEDWADETGEEDLADETADEDLAGGNY